MSMLTFAYNSAYLPSMPIVEIELSAPGRPPLNRMLSAIIDSGSDGTLIPLEVLEEAGARQVGEARLRGILGAGQWRDVYVVNIRIGPHLVRGVRAVASADSPEILLGRNAINHLIVTLNGPASTTEIPT